VTIKRGNAKANGNSNEKGKRKGINSSTDWILKKEQRDVEKHCVGEPPVQGGRLFKHTVVVKISLYPILFN
jgi:hypothetical protein